MADSGPRDSDATVPESEFLIDDGDGIVLEAKSRGRACVSLTRQRRARLFGLLTAIVVAVIVIAAVASSRNSPRHATNETGVGGDGLPWATIRLPTNIVPRRYDLLLFPDLDNLEFTGNVNITAEVTSPTPYVTLHSLELNITSVDVSIIATGEIVPILKTSVLPSYQFTVITTSSPLPRGRISILLSFAAPLTDTLAGLYLSTYFDRATNTTRRIAATQFEPTDARRAFPCFDEPELKAVVAVSVVVKDGYVPLSNMPELSRTPLSARPPCFFCPRDASTRGASYTVVRFADSVPMSTYLVALVVSDFQSVEATGTDIPVRVWGPPARTSQLALAANVTGRILSSYGRTFGIPYALPKLDLIAIPDFAAGAMENWGLITYRETALMYAPGISSTADEQWVSLVVAHELAHQWFGNYVTLNWWSALWLNEGFAARMEYLGVDAVFPEWDMDALFLPMTLLRALNTDSTDASHPIYVEVHNPAEINEIFDDISYEKGASLLRMLAWTLGEDVFYAGLRSYIHKYALSNADMGDLWDALTAAANGAVDVRAFMDAWVNRKGYPVVTVTRVNATCVAIRQEPYLRAVTHDLAATDPDADLQWQVPLAYYYGSSDVRRAGTLLGRQVLLELGPSCASTWLKLNAGNRGYFRVSYDAATDGCGGWSLLASEAAKGSLPAEDLAGLIDDAFSLAREGFVAQTVPLLLTQALPAYDDYLPWRVAIAQLDRLNALLQSTDAYDVFLAHLQRLLDTAVGRIGWDAQPTHMRRLFQATALTAAVVYDHAPSVERARQLFAVIMGGTLATPLPSDVRDAVFIAGVASGGVAEWEWSVYMTTEIPSEQERCLKALAATRRPWLLSRYLAYSLDPSKVRDQDVFIVLGHVAASPIGQQLAWDHVRTHWDALFALYGEGMAMSRVVSYVTGSFATRLRLDEFDLFFKGRDAGAAERAVAASRKKIQANIEWVEEHSPAVSAWLAQASR